MSNVIRFLDFGVQVMETNRTYVLGYTADLKLLTLVLVLL